MRWNYGIISIFPVRACYMFSNILKKVFGSRNERLIKRLSREVQKISALEEDYEKLSDDRFGEPSASVQARVESARDIQRQRFHQNHSSLDTANFDLLSCNSDMHPAEVRQYCQLDDTSRSLMRSAMTQMQLSARAYHRVLKLARTIADLARETDIAPQHLAEALQYRPKLTQL